LLKEESGRIVKTAVERKGTGVGISSGKKKKNRIWEKYESLVTGDERKTVNTTRGWLFSREANAASPAEKEGWKKKSNTKALDDGEKKIGLKWSRGGERTESPAGKGEI